MPQNWWNNVGKVLLYLAIRTFIGVERNYLLAILRIGVAFSESQPKAFTLAMTGQHIVFPKERNEPSAQLQLPLE